MLKLACQDKDKVSLTLSACVAPWGSHHIVFLFFTFCHSFLRGICFFSLFVSSVGLLLFVSVLGLSLSFFFLFLPFCTTSESWCQLIFGLFLPSFFKFSHMMSISFTLFPQWDLGIPSLCKIFPGKAQMNKIIYPFSYFVAWNKQTKVISYTTANPSGWDDLKGRLF